MLDDPSHAVREAAFSTAPSRKGFLLREDQLAYIQYGEDAAGGIELFDMKKDPQQYTNLAENPEYAAVVDEFRAKMTAKLAEIRTNDLGIDYKAPAAKKKKG